MDGTTAGTYLLSAEHVEGLERLAQDPEIAAILGAPATAYVARRMVAQTEGSAWSFVIMDRGAIIGVSTLSGLDGGSPTADVWIASQERSKGYATFAMRLLMD